MKKLLLGFVLLASVQAAFAAPGKLHVTGKLVGLGDSAVVKVIDLGTGNMMFDDTLAVNNASFDFTLPIDKVGLLHVFDLASARKNSFAGFTLAAVPDEELTINGDLATRYDIGGSKFYQQMHELDMVMEPLKTAQRALGTECNERVNNGESVDSVQAYYESKAPALQANLEKGIFEFVNAHPTYEASAVLVESLDSDKMQKLVDLLSPEVKNGRMKDYYMAYINQAKEQIAREEAAQKAQAIGVEAPDFTLNDINGKPLTLSSLRGKYVLLDFWGSWCVWCIKGIPDMKAYYEKYKGKYEILGIDCRDTDAKWREAVAKYELPWLHVFNGTGDNDVPKLYAIQGYPTKILIGPDGKIVKTIVGEDPAFYTFLDELFGK